MTQTRLAPVILKLAEIISDYDFNKLDRDPLEAEAYELIVMARIKLIQARAKLQESDIKRAS